jgi:hypothetical protein
VSQICGTKKNPVWLRGSRISGKISRPFLARSSLLL